MSCSPIPVYFCLLSRWHFVSQHVHRAVNPPTILSQSIHTETPWIRDFFPAKSSIVHPIHKFINNNSYCGKKKNPMFLLTHKQSNKAWCVPPWENCLSTTGRGGGEQGIVWQQAIFETPPREKWHPLETYKKTRACRRAVGGNLSHTHPQIIVYPWENLQCLSAGG